MENFWYLSYIGICISSQVGRWESEHWKGGNNGGTEELHFDYMDLEELAFILSSKEEIIRKLNAWRRIMDRKKNIEKL